MLVRAELQFEGFDNAMQPQKHIGSPCGLSLLYLTTFYFIPCKNPVPCVARQNVGK